MLLEFKPRLHDETHPNMEARLISFIEKILSAVLSYVMYEPFSVIPAEAGVCDGFSVNMILYLAVSFLYEALYHNTLDNVVKIFALGPVMKDLSYDPWLLIEFFSGVGMVGVADYAGEFELSVHIFLGKGKQILIVVVGVGLAVFVN